MRIRQLVLKRAGDTAAAAAAHNLTRHASVLAQKHCKGSDDGSISSSSSSSFPSWAAAVATALAAAGATAWGLASPAPAAALATAEDSSGSSYATTTTTSSGSSSEAKRAWFEAWMSSHGSDLSAVAVQPSRDAASGLGLFALPGIKQHIKHRWLGMWLGSLVLRGADNQTVTVATIPLNLSLTVETALAHPQLGQHFAELLELGLIDERSAVVLLLVVERARGEDSPYAPYLQLLPERFDTPLFYSEAQLQELSGTTLAAATAARKRALLRHWQQLRPAVEQMLQQVGLTAAPSLEDFLWATSVFWSRALTLPVTHADAAVQPQVGSSNGSNGSSGGSGDDGSSGSSDGSSGGSSTGGGSSGVLRFKVLEGLVPGLDFANHSLQPKCWWEVEPASSIQQAGAPSQQQQQQEQEQQQQPLVGASGSSHHVVKLMANRACCPKPGEELTISYGDKGNEELLLLYGFAQPQNPHETMMVRCPVPDPEEWDEAFTARMQLLQAKSLRPQLFLSTSHYEAASGKPLLLSPTAPVPESKDSSTPAAADSSNNGSSTGGQQPAGSKRRGSIVPEAAREVLEVFVLDKRELAAAVEQHQHQQQQQQQQGLLPVGGSNGSRGSETDATQEQMQRLGLDMAVLTTFARLLELKMVEMEGEGGTGSLESDLQQMADAAARENNSGNGAGTAAQLDGSLPTWQRNCVLYRAGQKALVRSYITAARVELQTTLAELQSLIGSDN